MFYISFQFGNVDLKLEQTAGGQSRDSTDTLPRENGAPAPPSVTTSSRSSLGLLSSITRIKHLTIVPHVFELNHNVNHFLKDTLDRYWPNRKKTCEFR